MRSLSQQEHSIVSNDKSTQDPLEFIRGMWSNMGFPLPGMMTPTLDINELDKRITDLKAVEHWLKVNLNMLQMTTQGLEMQRATLATMQAMSTRAAAAGSDQSEQQQDAGETQPNPFANAAALWPWNLVAAQTSDGVAEETAKPAEPRQSRRRTAAGSKTANAETKADKSGKN